jgi:hypothetical protein
VALFATSGTACAGIAAYESGVFEPLAGACVETTAGGGGGGALTGAASLVAGGAVAVADEPDAGGKPPAGVEVTERRPSTTLSDPYALPSLPNPAYDEGNAVKFGPSAGCAGGCCGGGVAVPGAVEAAPGNAVVVVGASGAIPAMLLSYPERALH